MDLSVLSPEEVAELKSALEQYDTVAAQPEPMAQPEHADMDDDRQFVEPIVQALELLATANEEMSQKITLLEKIVMDDIIGGVREMYDGHIKTSKIGELKNKYANVFDPLEPAWKGEGGDGDIYDKLFNVIEEMKGNEGFDEAGEVNKMADELKGKIPKVESPEPEGLTAVFAKIKSQKDKSKGLDLF